MATVVEIAPPSGTATLSPTAPRWPWLLLRTATATATLGAFVQAVRSGGVTGGRAEALPQPSAAGLLLETTTLVLLVALALAWRTGGAPAWVLAAGSLVAVAEAVRLGVGVTPDPTVHTPLTTTLLLVQVALLVWSWQRPLPDDPA